MVGQHFVNFINCQSELDIEIANYITAKDIAIRTTKELHVPWPKDYIHATSVS